MVRKQPLSVRNKELIFLRKKLECEGVGGEKKTS